MIADDLTGAVDCAASSAALGCIAVVLLHSREDQKPEADWPDADILSIDANTRCLPAEEASRLLTQLVHLCDTRHSPLPGYLLFKKIDSTLRGNVADELAALLRARRSMNPANRRLSILMAPAFPAQGRTTLGGRLFVHGVPLEETDIWQAETRTPQSDISELLAEAGLSCKLIDIETVRSNPVRLQQALLQLAEQTEVIVCDAATDEDLRAITKASLALPTFTALAGSAGLASQVPQAIGIAPATEHFQCCITPGPTLFVAGTAASVTRQQAGILESTPDIAAFHATPAVLHNSPALHTQIIQSLRSNRDVLLMLDGEEQCPTYEGQLLPGTLSDLISKCAPLLGGLVATGGETARAVLDALGIQRLRVLGEVEAGLPISVADGWMRPLPIITKAGAFGSPQALVRCRESLRKLERAQDRLYARDPLIHHET